MKIALITNYWKNSDGGGIKTYLVKLVDALQDRRGDVSVLFRQGEDPEHFCGGENKIIFSFTCYRQLRKIHQEVISIPRKRWQENIFYKQSEFSAG